MAVSKDGRLQRVYFSWETELNSNANGSLFCRYYRHFGWHRPVSAGEEWGWFLTFHWSASFQCHSSFSFHISPSWISCSNSTYLSPFVSGSNTGSWLSGFLCVEGTVSLRCPLARNKSMYVYFEREILILPLLIDSAVIHRGNSVRVSCEFKGIINQFLWEDLWFSPLLLFPLPFLYYAGLWYIIRVYTCLAQTMPRLIY